MSINQVVAGAAALTSTATAFTAGSPSGGGTFTVASAAGYPSSGRFVVQLNRGEADEEKVLIASRSGTTFTVETRGYDGSTAQSHTNPTVNLILPATVVNALIEHVDDIEATPHATKLPVGTISGHDTTTRHVLGTSIPVSASTPATITPDAAGSAGAASAVARSDHSHPIAAATPGSIAPDDSAAEGVSTSFARADHTHGIVAAVAGIIAPDDSAAEGVATSFARSDHRHGITTATPVAVTTALAEGVAATFARSDHAHTVGAGAVAGTSALADGIVTLAKMASEASTDFTGTVDFCSGTFVLGTGGTQFAKYFKLGRIVFGWCGFVLGTGGNIVGNFELTLPFTSANNGARGFAAARARHDPDVPVAGVGTIVANTNTAVSFGTFGGASVWNATFPFNWDLNDSVECVFFYEAAS